MSTIMLDTHVLHWWSAEPERLSEEAARTVRTADELAVAAITWFEMAWLANHERIVVTIPTGTWLQRLSRGVRTLPLTPAIGAAAVALPTSFPGGPVDRLIYATALEHGYPLVTKDSRLLEHPSPRTVAVW